MRFSSWILVFAFVTLGATAHADPSAADCVPATEMSAIAQHFTQFRNLAGREYCYTNTEESALIQSLMFMRKTMFANSMPKSSDELFSGAFANDWYGYFIGRIDDISIQASCPKGVGAYVYGFGSTMYVCPMLMSANFTSLDRASVMMHEARHIDGFPHMTCSRGARQGLQGACDTRIADHGSYGVTVETYAQIAAYATDLHPVLRAYARSSAVVYADEAFENPVRIDRAQQFMLVTTQGEFHTLNLQNGVKTTKLGKTPALGRINMRGQHMVLYPDDKNLTAEYVFAHDEGKLAQAAGDIAVEYNALAPAQRGDWVDVHVGAQWSARVMKTAIKIGCDPRSESTTTVSTNGETPASVLYPNGYERAAKMAHVAMASGKIFEFGCESGGRAYLRASNTRFDQAYKRIYKAGTDVVGLTADGRLFRINGTSSTALQTPLDGRVYEIAPHQSVNFLD